MRQIPRSPKHARAGFQTADNESALRDQMLVALTDRALMLQIAEATHGAASWSSSAHSTSQRELQEGVELIDAERERIEERLTGERARQAKLGSSIALAASEAGCERMLCRLRELAEHREHLTGLLGRIKSDVEVESIEWQRALTLQDGSVVGFVDLWATLRVTSYRVSQGSDPADPEQRIRYEGYSVHHLIRSLALFVEPTVASLTSLVRQVRYAQAYAKNALPILVTCEPVARELLAHQGIPTYLWSADAATMVAQPPPVVTTRRVRRVSSVRPSPAPRKAPAQLPSPQASLPPAPLA